MKRTTDVYFAATLLALGYKLELVDRKDPRHMVFEFIGKKDGNLGKLQEDVSQENLDALETQWANRSLMVNAFDQAEAIKRMKSIIHSS
jgi:hypothetical protein